MAEELFYRRLVKPSDLNSANRLFGGQMLSWIDDVGSTYAMYQLQTTSVVTAKVSEVNFIHPALQGDLLEFYVSTVKVGKTCLTVRVRVVAKTFTHSRNIVDCLLLLVHIDSQGKPTSHGKTVEDFV